MNDKHTNIIFSSAARKRLLEGLNMTADAVGCTLGPKGKTVLIQQDGRTPLVTKDGVTVSKSINFKDPLLQLGSKLVQEAAARTNDVAGDGTTTSTILTQALVNECEKYVTVNHSAFSIKNGMQTAAQLVVNNLIKMSKFISSNDDIESVATISANGSKHIGKLIASAIETVTRDGVITIEDAKGMNTSVEVVDGMQIDRGYLSPYFVNNNNKMTATYENCRVLVSTEKISDINSIVKILTATMQNNEPLLIIADDIDGTALHGLVLNRTKQNLQVVAIKAPGYGSSRSDYLSDICALTGAKLVSPITGLSLDSVTRNDLGTCRKVISSKSVTTLVGTKSSSLDDHVKNLKEQLADVTISHEQSNLLRSRVASLVNGVAVIKVGGATELEMNERRDRVEDALNATRAAMEEGIVPGGGMALLVASKTLVDVKPQHVEPDLQSFQAGVDIVRRACESPFKRIIENAGQNFELLKSQIPNEPNQGYDARGGQFVDMLKHGIIDPVKVTRCALEHAMSVAITFISLDAVVYEETTEK